MKEADSGLTAAISNEAAAEVIAKALPYIQAFSGHIFVIKYGGSAMSNQSVVERAMQNVLLLQAVGIKVVLVHGGGPEIDRMLQRLSIPKKVHQGLRVTDEPTMEIVEMALSGKANKGLASMLGRMGGKAIGLSGRDGGLLHAEPKGEEWGLVGTIVKVNGELLELAASQGFIPVVASVAEDESGQALNVNADEAAAAIAAAIGASKLILLTDTNGVLADKDRRDSTISHLTPAIARQMLDSGAADRGMIPKLNAALRALEGGVKQVHMLDGSFPNALLVELFTEGGIGTMIMD